ncbi:carbohydrate sulfotransferase 11-like [Liolophura sinensis]|uniref:carbohydrate sulfotransferase 11-like n=1 Tax=Liolophura sinensis TaxID=3198878 RepID=UPI0031597243
MAKSDSVYRERRETLLKACEGNISEYRWNNLISNRLWVDEKHRLLYCPIAKVASSFWKRVFQVSSGTKTGRNYRKNPDKLSLSCGHNVTFPEFIKHVIRTVQTKSGIDTHWMPMFMQCSPCEVEYDLIGKLETTSQDLNYIMEKYIGDDIIFRDMESESEVDRLEKNVYGLYGR